MEALINRWRANTAAAGIRLDESDIAHSLERGALNSIVAVEAVLTCIDAHEQLPDYLAPLAAAADDAGTSAEGERTHG